MVDQLAVDLYARGKQLGLDNEAILRVIGLTVAILDLTPFEAAFFLEALRLVAASLEED